MFKVLQMLINKSLRSKKCCDWGSLAEGGKIFRLCCVLGLVGGSLIDGVVERIEVVQS